MITNRISIKWQISAVFLCAFVALAAFSFVSIPSAHAQASCNGAVCVVPLAGGQTMTVSDPNDPNWGNGANIAGVASVLGGGQTTNITWGQMVAWLGTIVENNQQAATLVGNTVTCINGATFTLNVPTPSGCGAGTLNDQCPPPTPSGCGAGTLNDECCSPYYNYCSGNTVYDNCGDYIQSCGYGCSGGSCNPAPTPSGCGPGTLNDQCTPSGCGAGTLNNQCPVPSCSVSAGSARLIVGQSTMLTWSSSNATTVTGTGFSTGGSQSGTVTVTPAQTTTYGLSCSGYGGTNASSATITVVPIPIYQEI